MNKIMETFPGSWCKILLAVAIVCLLPSVVYPGNTSLKIYGPGGLLNPMQECAEIFSRNEANISAKFIGGKGSGWINKAGKDADLICLGVAHLYSQFMLQYSGMVEKTAWEGLYMRPAGILVRKGNPKNIKSLKDLAKPGIRLLNVACPGQVATWEDLAGRQELIPGILQNFAVTVKNGFKGAKVWKENPELDAWITFASWHFSQKKFTDLVEIPASDNVFRMTFVAGTAKCRDREAADKFITFLKSEHGHAIFRKWGWK